MVVFDHVSCFVCDTREFNKIAKNICPITSYKPHA